MSETAPIVISIVGTGVGIVGLTALMFRMLWTSMARQFDAVNSQFQAVNSQFQAIDNQFQAINNQFQAINSRLQHIENRIDDTNKRIDAIGRDIAELRDRTGTLEGTLSTFLNARQSPSAA